MKSLRVFRHRETEIAPEFLKMGSLSHTLHYDVRLNTFVCINNYENNKFSEITKNIYNYLF